MSKAAGIDQILAKFLKEDAEILTVPLFVLTVSFFSSQCKFAKLQPLFKKSQKT